MAYLVVISYLDKLIQPSYVLLTQQTIKVSTMTEPTYKLTPETPKTSPGATLT